MRRWSIAAALIVVLAAIVAGSAISSSGRAQDDYEARIVALETQVADLTARVAALEGSSEQPTEPSGTPASADGSIVISGTGGALSDEFHLEAGRYIAAVDVSSGCCISVKLHGATAGQDLLFAEIFAGDNGGSTAAIYVVEQTGSYFLEVSGTDADWTVMFTPR